MDERTVYIQTGPGSPMGQVLRGSGHGMEAAARGERISR
jgi:hypothetical protein